MRKVGWNVASLAMTLGDIGMSGDSVAQSYPNKPITIVAAYPPSKKRMAVAPSIPTLAETPGMESCEFPVWVVCSRRRRRRRLSSTGCTGKRYQAVRMKNAKGSGSNDRSATMKRRVCRSPATPTPR